MKFSKANKQLIITGQQLSADLYARAAMAVEIMRESRHEPSRMYWAAAAKGMQWDAAFVAELQRNRMQVPA